MDGFAGPGIDDFENAQIGIEMVTAGRFVGSARTLAPGHLRLGETIGGDDIHFAGANFVREVAARIGIKIDCDARVTFANSFDQLRKPCVHNGIDCADADGAAQRRWIADCLAHMKRCGYTIVEATEEGADIWDAKSAAVAEKMIRRQVDNYMVHVNADDGSRIFQPWGAGMATYVPEVRAMTARVEPGGATVLASVDRSDAHVILRLDLRRPEVRP